jgi:mono/diheme cytochrome c family protein
MSKYGFRLRYIAVIVCTIGALLWIRSDEGLAQQKSSQEEVALSGKPLYDQYCATCHGRDGKGGGPSANLLSVKPTDLTQIAKNNKGDFPFWSVYDAIDGRKLVKGHGDREMPIWGQALTLGGSTAAGAQARGQILALVHYIQSIQVQ